MSCCICISLLCVCGTGGILAAPENEGGCVVADFHGGVWKCTWSLWADQHRRVPPERQRLRHRCCYSIRHVHILSVWKHATPLLQSGCSGMNIAVSAAGLLSIKDRDIFRKRAALGVSNHRRAVALQGARTVMCDCTTLTTITTPRASSEGGGD